MPKIVCYIALIAALTGCATSGQSGLIDFNSRFDANVPTNPKYKIEPVGINRYQVVVYQGSILISERTTRASYLTKAALISMESHCITKGQLIDDYKLQDHVDSMGYINLLGFFTCTKMNEKEPNNLTKKDI
jgi:hypothetical protein